MPGTAALAVRTWNVAHLRDRPPAAGGLGHVRRKHLAAVARLAIEGNPDLVLLQEVPAWAGQALAAATGRHVAFAVAYGAHLPFLHLPLPLRLAGAFARAAPDVARSQVEGQGNALLVGAALELVETASVPLNRRLRLRGEPRIAQLARLRHAATGTELAVANVHIDAHDPVAQADLAAAALIGFAAHAPALLGGDLNARPGSPALNVLRDHGFTGRGRVGIDHLLVRGLDAEGPQRRWPPARRDVIAGGVRVRLSDHDPVDLSVSLRAA